MRVRSAVEADVDRMLELMIGLAKYEGYFDAFSVTRESILDKGFRPSALFDTLVVEIDGCVVAYAVTYVIPWTYTLRPKVVLKELFVDVEFRASGAGRLLFNAVVDKARQLGSNEVAWTVLTGNEKAEQFYRKLGGRPDEKWNNWMFKVDSRCPSRLSGGASATVASPSCSNDRAL